MSTVGIFILGAVVTLLVAAALGLVIVGAIQDGRLARQERARARRVAGGESPPPMPGG